MLSISYQMLSDRAITPTQATPGDAGYDLYATDSAILQPGERRLFPTNIAMHIPDGYYGRVAPRSGRAYKHGLDVLAGVIDASYRGDVGVILINLWSEDFEVKQGDRIAQLIIEKTYQVTRNLSSNLDESVRGEWGFGSTGR